MWWREGRSCPPSLPCSPMALGDQVGWGDAGGGLGHRAYCGLGFEGEARRQREHDVFRDRLKRDSTSPTFHHDNFCRFIFSAQIWGSECSKRGCGGGLRGGGRDEEGDALLPPSLPS